MLTGSRMYNYFGSTLRNGLVTGTSHTEPVDHGVLPEVDWNNLNAQ